MSEAKDCPKCGLVNSPEAQRCDCGYDFAARAMRQSYAGPATPNGPGGCARVAGFASLGLAALLFLSGLVVAARVPNVAAGDTGALGQVTGAFCPSAVILGLGVLLLRRR